MSFVIYDLSLLVLFSIFAAIFLYTRRRNLKQEGALLLYKTSWGIKLIDLVGIKYKKLLHFLSYISIGLGYVFMASILYLVIQTVYIYFTTPIMQIIKAPPIMPLIPYFPKLFGLQSMFPPFYFTYFILALAVVLTVHEFSHGIFARSFGIKIKSTGFAFLKYFPALFGAFVEQDDKQMTKKSNFAQMSVLSAGVFANILASILFFIMLVLFFSLAFAPSGVLFNTYSYSIVKISDISSVNGMALEDVSSSGILGLMDDEKELNQVLVDEENYLITPELVDNQFDKDYITLFHDAPAINVGLKGAIININGESIESIEKLGQELSKYSPGESIIVLAKTLDGEESFEVVLGEHPEDKTKSWLGVGFIDRDKSTLTRKLVATFSYKEDNVYYEPKYDGISVFIHDLLWWIFLINLLVALMNMMPVGFLDGGQFFYLTVLSVTKSEKLAKQFFAGITYFILFLFLVLMVKWAFGVF